LLKSPSGVFGSGLSITSRFHRIPHFPIWVFLQQGVSILMGALTLPSGHEKVRRTTLFHWFAIRRLVICFALFSASLILSACGPGGEDLNGPIISNNTPSGITGSITLSLAWNAVPDPSVTGYILYYGTSSPLSYGSCAYDHRVFSPSPSATISGLASNTTYYFAVSAYNGLESACSDEVSTTTESI